MKKKKLLIGLAVFACIMILFIILIHYKGKLGSFRGASFSKYLNYTYNGDFFVFNKLPKGAQDFKFQATNLGLSRQSFAGFNLSGNDYNEYIASLSELEEPSDFAKEKFIGKKVSDTYGYYNDLGYSGYTGFPKKKIRYAADGDISEYTILYYNVYRGDRLRSNAVLYNPKKGRFIVYCEGSN